MGWLAVMYEALGGSTKWHFNELQDPGNQNIRSTWHVFFTWQQGWPPIILSWETAIKSSITSSWVWIKYRVNIKHTDTGLITDSQFVNYLLGTSYLYMNLQNIRESEECNLSDQQDFQTVRRDFPIIPKSSVKFLWVKRTYRNVSLAIWRPRSWAWDCGGRTGVPNKALLD